MRKPVEAPGARMSDAQYAATLSELRRLTLVGSVPPCLQANHVLERPELVPTRREIVAGLRERFKVKYAPAPRRLGPDGRRNMRTSRS